MAENNTPERFMRWILDGGLGENVDPKRRAVLADYLGITFPETAPNPYPPPVLKPDEVMEILSESDRPDILDLDQDYDEYLAERGLSEVIPLAGPAWIGITEEGAVHLYYKTVRVAGYLDTPPWHKEPGSLEFVRILYSPKTIM